MLIYQTGRWEYSRLVPTVLYPVSYPGRYWICYWGIQSSSPYDMHARKCSVPPPPVCRVPRYETTATCRDLFGATETWAKDQIRHHLRGRRYSNQTYRRWGKILGLTSLLDRDLRCCLSIAIRRYILVLVLVGSDMEYRRLSETLSYLAVYDLTCNQTLTSPWFKLRSCFVEHLSSLVSFLV